MPVIDLTGQKFGLLTVVKRIPSNRVRWLCLCECGKTKEVASFHLRAGSIKSCGHLIGEATRKRCTKHGHKSRGRKTDETYSTWCAMWTRCTNPNQGAWARYGGRGISVCDRWRDFSAFLADMGKRPQGCTLDRIDVNGNYEPANCRWATASQQRRNQRNSICIEYKGQLKPLAEWAEHMGLHYSTLYNRIYRYGWPIEKALRPATAPPA